MATRSEPELVAEEPRWWAVYAWQGAFLVEDSAREEVVKLLHDLKTLHPNDPEPIRGPVDFARSGSLLSLMVPRSFEEVELDGLHLRIPSDDLQGIAEAAKVLVPHERAPNLYLLGGNGVGVVVRAESWPRVLATLQAAVTPEVAVRGAANRDRIRAAEDELKSRVALAGRDPQGSTDGKKLLN